MQRRFAGVLRVDQLGNLPDLSRHSGRHNDAFAASGGHDRALIRHIHPVAQRNIARGKKARIFFHRRGFAGQRGFVYRKPLGNGEPHVGRHNAPRLKQHHVAHDQFIRRDLAQRAVTPGERHRHRQLFQRRKRLLGAPFLHRADHRVYNHDRKNDKRIRPFIYKRGQHRRREQDINHRFV